METIAKVTRASKEERIAARESYSVLTDALREIKGDKTEIEIEETGERIKLPSKALELLNVILKAMGEGTPFSIIPEATEVTTQQAAEMLGCSRPHIVKLLEEGTIPFVKVGRHRRIRLEDVMKYKQQMKALQKQRLIEMMQEDEDLGLYDI